MSRGAPPRGGVVRQPGHLRGDHTVDPDLRLLRPGAEGDRRVGGIGGALGRASTDEEIPRIDDVAEGVRLERRVRSCGQRLHGEEGECHRGRDAHPQPGPAGGGSPVAPGGRDRDTTEAGQAQQAHADGTGVLEQELHARPRRHRAEDRAQRDDHGGEQRGTGHPLGDAGRADQQHRGEHRPHLMVGPGHRGRGHRGAADEDRRVPGAALPGQLPGAQERRPADHRHQPGPEHGQRPLVDPEAQQHPVHRLVAQRGQVADPRGLPDRLGPVSPALAGQHDRHQPGTGSARRHRAAGVAVAPGREEVRDEQQRGQLDRRGHPDEHPAQPGWDDAHPVQQCQQHDENADLPETQVALHRRREHQHRGGHRDEQRAVRPIGAQRDADQAGDGDDRRARRHQPDALEYALADGGDRAQHQGCERRIGERPAVSGAVLVQRPAGVQIGQCAVVDVQVAEPVAAPEHEHTGHQRDDAERRPRQRHPAIPHRPRIGERKAERRSRRPLAAQSNADEHDLDRLAQALFLE